MQAQGTGTLALAVPSSWESGNGGTDDMPPEVPPYHRSDPVPQGLLLVLEPISISTRINLKRQVSKRLEKVIK